MLGSCERHEWWLGDLFRGLRLLRHFVFPGRLGGAGEGVSFFAGWAGDVNENRRK